MFKIQWIHFFFSFSILKFAQYPANRSADSSDSVSAVWWNCMSTRCRGGGGGGGVVQLLAAFHFSFPSKIFQVFRVDSKDAAGCFPSVRPEPPPDGILFL